MAYQLNGEDHVLAWIVQATRDEAEAMLEWLPSLAEDPVAVASASWLAQACRRTWPGLAVPTFVDYAVVEQFKTVLILQVVSDVALA